MSTYVTVNTSATSSVLVPFTSAANAVIAQAALDATDNKFIALAPELVSYFTPAASVSGSVTVPATTFFGAVANTNSNTLDFGAFDSLYNTMVTGAMDSPGSTLQGGGKVQLVGASSTSVWSGAGASLVYLNTNTKGAVYLGGNSTTGDAITNSDATDKVNIWTGNDSVQSLTTVVDSIGGGATVHTSGNALMRFYTGGSDSIIANGGTMAVEAVSLAGSAAGVLTISAASAGTELVVHLGGSPVFITPGAGNVLVSPLIGGAESSATLFGGTRVIAGQTVTASAFTGTAHVLRGMGYFEGGSAGGNELQTGTTTGAATIVAGGANDKLWIAGQADVAILGNAANVQAAANFTGAFNTSVGGAHFVMGSGSGSVLGSGHGYDDFTFTGSGTYTVIGGHDTTPAATSAGFLHGSVYHQASTAGGGYITILDFSPTAGSPTTATGARDIFDLGTRSVSSLNSVQVSVAGANTFYDNTAVLSDGTSIVFKNTLGTVHNVGTSII
jgi:hypothetical protein